MRWSKGFTRVLAGTGLCVAGAHVLVGCGKDFNGCEATRTCERAGAAGGAGDDDGSSKGAKAGQGGKGGSSAIETGEGGAGNGGKGGSWSSTAGGGGRAPADGGAGERESSGQGGRAGGAIASEAGAGGSEPEGASGAGGEGATPPTTDEEAPHIVASSPANGDHGVRSDAEIRVKFSERMDNESVEAAFRSDTLPAVKLLWDNDSTELVIQPTEPLAYADGSDPGATAKFYSFTIAGSARDVAGNAMGDERTFVFTTVRHLKHRLTIPTKWARKLSHPADGSADSQALGCTSPDSVLSAGDAEDDTALAFVVAFDLGALPRGVLEWGRATLDGSELGGTETNPYSRLGALEGYVVSTPLTDILWNVPTTGELGLLAEYKSQVHFEKNVLDFVPAAYEAGTPLTFLVRFENATDDNGDEALASIRCKDVGLELEYWAP